MTTDRPAYRVLDWLAWTWRHQQARHRVWEADLACRRWPSPRNRNAHHMAAVYLRRVEIRRP
jgi:hypothetical protein